MKVTNVLSEAYSTTLPADAESTFEPIDPERVDRMGYPLAELQMIEWETYGGVYGPSTLLKEVEHSTSECDECGGEGWKDEHGDVICRDCGMVLNASPEMIPYDPGSGRCNGSSGMQGGYVFFNDAGKQALNQNTVNKGADEPDVQ